MIHQSIMGGLAIDSTGRKATNEKKRMLMKDLSNQSRNGIRYSSLCNYTGL